MQCAHTPDKKKGGCKFTDYSDNLNFYRIKIYEAVS